MNIRRTLRMWRARYRAQALLATLTDGTSTIASAQALDEGGRIMADLIDVNVRLRTVTMLRAHGIEIPNEAEMITSLKTRERELKVAEQKIVVEAVATVTTRLGVTPEDANAVRNRRRKRERDARKANGDCVECPKGKVERAAPGSTTCDECGQRRNARIRNYRQRKKTQEGATQCGTKGATKKNVGRKGTATAGHRTKDGGRRNPQSGMARGAIEGPAKTPQAEPERSDADCGFPNSREQDNDAGGEPSRRPILTDATGGAYRIRSAGVPKGRRMTFVADFVYEREMPDGTWHEVIEDVKGFDTPTARVKRAIAEQLFGTKIELVRAEKRAAR